MATWIAQYVYLEEDGSTGIATHRFTASGREEAMKKAASDAPAADFALSIHLESDDQHLGAIRHRALEMTGKAIIIDTGDAREDLEDWEDLENGEMEPDG